MRRGFGGGDARGGGLHFRRHKSRRPRRKDNKRQRAAYTYKHSEAVALVLLLARAGRLFPFCLFAQVRNALPRPLGGIKESERFSAPLCVLFQLGS
jgi:hypothetical protein